MIGYKIKYFIIALQILSIPLLTKGFVNDIRGYGYSLIPAPQRVNLSGEEVVIDESWTVYTDLGKESPVFKKFISAVDERWGLKFNGGSQKKIVLEINPKSTTIEVESPNSEQGYRLEIQSDLVRITGNSAHGLFYGIQSFLQLLDSNGNKEFRLPEGTIVDWPDLELRVIHWDTKHHQDRLETLKRYLDQAALFKINAVAFEIEDKYEYPRHPVIGAPGAFTKTEMHELTAYARERFIELIPLVQAPSHMTYVLKHDEFAHLKADANNYHICMCNEEAMQLILDMYQDMIDATPGVNYFFVSTDEVYYAGICDQCEREYNEKNRSQIWVDYVNRVHNWMSERNRRMLAWVEYPLLENDITKLPKGLIDGIMGTYRSKTWVENENEAGIEQLAYSSMQGAEYLFPNYFPVEYRTNITKGRLFDASKNVIGTKEQGAELIGTFAAAWDDAGLHNETFWLGWATVTQYGWTSQKPTLEQNVADFMDVFYGKECPFMVDVYRSLMEGARFYEDVWDRKISVERGPAYGNSRGKGIGTERHDLLLEMPALPDENSLKRNLSFRVKYTLQIEKARQLFLQNDRLINQLMFASTRVSWNRYNLEVLLSLAYLEGYTINTVLNLAKIDTYLDNASKADDPAEGVKQLVEAHELAGEIVKEQEQMWNQFTNTWEKSRFEKGQSVEGRSFVHVMDDVKDHFADRRLGLDYMLAPFQRMDISGWRNKLSSVIKHYATTHQVQISGEEIERLED